jgi:hypothetical protein
MTAILSVALEFVRKDDFAICRRLLHLADEIFAPYEARRFEKCAMHLCRQCVHDRQSPIAARH